MIEAAGALPWRHQEGTLEVAMVHRPRYGDWAWAKGKLEPDEEWPVAGVREVLEETGFQVRLGRTLPTSEYTIAVQSGPPATKRCRYWAAEVVSGDGALLNEIDEVAWLDLPAAAARLSYTRDHDQLHALEQADRTGTLATWPLVVVRHAKSRSRSSWTNADPLRPLNPRGRQRAKALVPILSAYQVARVVTSPSVRCLDTVAPYAAATKTPIRLRWALSEEGFAEQPEQARYHLTRLLERGNAAALCSHGPVLPMLLEHLAEISESHSSGWSDSSDPSVAAAVLREAADNGIGKGEALVAHIVGTGEQAVVVDVERYPAP